MRTEERSVRPVPADPTARRAAATRAAFFIAGFCTAAWAPLVPFAKARLGIDAGGLGLVLIAPGVGSILTMAVAGALAARLGCRRVIVAASLVLFLALPVLAWTPALAPMVAALFVFGAAIGAIDVAANIQAIAVEKSAGAAMMSGFHGFYSIGGIAGAAGSAGLIAAGAPPLAATLAIVAMAAGVLARAAPHLIGEGAQGEGPIFAAPRGIVWLLGALGFIMFLVEGAVLDWGALFLSAARAMARSRAGFGYAAFAVAMTAGRLLGDRWVGAVGGRVVVLAGALVAAAGFGLAVAAPSWPPALAGFALVGLGCANIVPVLFTAAGAQSAMPQALAVPAITTASYTGVLAGPAAIGFIARAAGLPAAFAVLAVLLGAVAAASRVLPGSAPAGSARPRVSL
ncbi:MAG: MFS transporter [Caulobacteraceae bacterium]